MSHLPQVTCYFVLFRDEVSSIHAGQKYFYQSTDRSRLIRFLECHNPVIFLILQMGKEWETEKVGGWRVISAGVCG